MRAESCIEIVDVGIRFRREPHLPRTCRVCACVDGGDVGLEKVEVLDAKGKTKYFVDPTTEVSEADQEKSNQELRKWFDLLKNHLERLAPSKNRIAASASKALAASFFIFEKFSKKSYNYFDI